MIQSKSLLKLPAFVLSITFTMAFGSSSNEQVRSIRRISTGICQNVSPFNVPEGCYPHVFGPDYSGDTAYNFADYNCVDPLYYY